MRPISDLTRPDIEWSWTSSHDKAFEEVKYLLTVAPVLAYFDPRNFPSSAMLVHKDLEPLSYKRDALLLMRAEP